MPARCRASEARSMRSAVTTDAGLTRCSTASRSTPLPGLRHLQPLPPESGVPLPRLLAKRLKLDTRGLARNRRGNTCSTQMRMSVAVTHQPVPNPGPWLTVRHRRSSPSPACSSEPPVPSAVPLTWRDAAQPVWDRGGQCD
jgi:hypothetical protein